MTMREKQILAKAISWYLTSQYKMIVSYQTSRRCLHKDGPIRGRGGGSQG